MDRKDFLKVCGVVIGGSTALPLLAASSKPEGLRVAKDMSLWQFYGTGDGKIYNRARPEDPWVLHADFGAEYGIYSIYRSGRDILADVDHAGKKFTLRLTPDGRHWVNTDH